MKWKEKYLYMVNTPVKFNTKIIQDNKVYLPLSDVVKALGCKRLDFINEHSQLVEKISGVLCIQETDYNNLLAENETALSNQGQIEVTKIEALRSKVDTVMSFQPLKFALARDYLQMMAARTGCKSVEEYVLLHEIPEEKQKAFQELIQNNEYSRSSYQKMIDYLNDKEKFAIEKIRNFGLGVQYLTTIKSNGRLSLDAYVVGKGVFCNVSDFGNYECWNDMYIDDYSNLILPYCNYDAQPIEEILVNLSYVEVDGIRVDRDFSKYNVVENMMWCIENLKIQVLEDYECSVFSMFSDTIKFDMPLELLVKLIRPDAVDTIYIDKIIDVETESYLTEFDKKKVFSEDFPCN